MNKTTQKTSNDLISDAIDSFMAGNENMANYYLHEAIESKLVNHMCKCLKDVYKNNNN